MQLWKSGKKGGIADLGRRGCWVSSVVAPVELVQLMLLDAHSLATSGGTWPPKDTYNIQPPTRAVFYFPPI